MKIFQITNEDDEGTGDFGKKTTQSGSGEGEA